MDYMEANGTVGDGSVLPNPLISSGLAPDWRPELPYIAWHSLITNQPCTRNVDKLFSVLIVYSMHFPLFAAICGEIEIIIRPICRVLHVCISEKSE